MLARLVVKVWGGPVLHDLRYACRLLLRSPGSALTIVLTLSLCIGANSALFSVVDAVLLRPLPFERSGELYVVQSTHKGVPTDYSSSIDLDGWREGTRAFSHLAAIYGHDASITTPGGPEYLSGWEVSEEFFALFHQRPALGRTFVASEHRKGQDRVVVLNHGLWLRRFGGDPAAVGRNVILDGDPHLIVGVLPEGFSFPEGTEFWRPLTQKATARVLRVVARLRSGVTAAGAQAQLDGAARRLDRLHPERNRDWGARLVPLHARSTEAVSRTLLALWGAVTCVLLIACANVGILLLSRTLRRAPELAVRVALGATRVRILRQLLTESALLGLLGGLGGVLTVGWGGALLLRLAPSQTPRLQDVGVDLHVLVYTGAVALGAGILMGIIPAWQTLRSAPRHVLGGATPWASRGRDHRRARTILAAGQVLVSVVLLVGSGLMIESLRRLHAVDLGFDADRLLTFYVSLPERQYKGDVQMRSFYADLLGRLRALPGVHSASAINALFIHWGQAIVVPVPIEGRARAQSIQPARHSRQDRGPRDSSCARDTDHSGSVSCPPERTRRPVLRGHQRDHGDAVLSG